MEEQHSNGVGEPALFTFFFDTCRPIKDQLNWPKDWGQKGALAVEYARHIAAEHGRDRHDDRAIEQNLNPADGGHDTEPCCLRRIFSETLFVIVRIRTALASAKR